MLTLDELRNGLEVTEEDVKRVSPEIKKLMAISPNAGFSVESDFAFQCECCTAIEGRPAYYRLTKRQFCFPERRSDARELKSTEGIVRLRELSFVPEFSSVVHVTRDGLVCDHCYDSVYAD